MTVCLIFNVINGVATIITKRFSFETLNSSQKISYKYYNDHIFWCEIGKCLHKIALFSDKYIHNSSAFIDFDGNKATPLLISWIFFNGWRFGSNLTAIDSSRNLLKEARE